MKVFDAKEGKEVEVSENDLPHIASSDRFQIPSGEYEFEDQFGARGKVSAENFQKALSDGMTYIPKSVVEKEERISQAANEPFSAAGAAVARGLTFGISDKILTEIGAITPQKLKDLEEANPVISTVAETGAALAPIALSGGTGAVANVAKLAPTAAADFLGKEIAKKATGKILSKTTSQVAKKVIESGIGSAYDAALYGTGRLLTEDAMGDAEFNAESVMATMGTNALLGGAFGVGSTLAFKGAEKAINKSVQKVQESINKFAESGDIGILKKLGATKGQFKQLIKSNSLDEKELVDHALDLTKGFEDTVESIVANQGVTKKGGQSLVNAATASLEEISENNQTVKKAAGKIMESAIKDIDDEFEKYLINPIEGKFKKEDLVYGVDIAKRIDDEVLSKMQDIYTPRRAALEKIRDEITELGVIRDDLGNIVSRKPLSPIQIKAQSVELGNLAKFEKANPTGAEEVYRDLRGFLEQRLEGMMDKLEGGSAIVEKYKKGKKLYQKSAVLDDMLQNGIARDYANNRGLSLTEGLSAATGAAAAGPIGALAGYALRKGQREYGDVAISYIMRKLEKASNKSKIDISDAVDGFFKGAQKTAVKYLTSQDIPKSEVKNIEDKINIYQQSPDVIIENFVKNNPDVLDAAPKTAMALQDRMRLGTEFLASKVPQKQISPFQDTEYKKSDILKFKSYVDAVEDPYKTIRNIKAGYITPEGAEALRVVYPKIFQALKDEFAGRIPEFKNITEKQKADLSRLLGLDAKKAYTPQGFATLQAGSRAAIQQAEAPQKVPMTAARNLRAAQRTQTGLDRTLYRA